MPFGLWVGAEGMDGWFSTSESPAGTLPGIMAGPCPSSVASPGERERVKALSLGGSAAEVPTFLRVE